MTIMIDYIYDEETYLNVFTLAIKEAGTDNRWMFEISDWVDDSKSLGEFMLMLRNTSARMVGFNNINFDYPILHHLLQLPNPTAYTLWEKANSIITSNDRFGHIIWDRDQYVPQVDLFKINHFDNKARGTSLKLLEFNMRRPHIEDLPFPPNTELTAEQVPILREYNWEDVDATEEFYFESLDAIRFREDLTQRYGRNFINDNDTKIGKQIYVMKLEEQRPGSCYEYVDKKRVPRQTIHHVIPLHDVVFPYIQFHHPELQRIHQWFLNQTMYDENDIKGVSATIDDFQFEFGKGGVHGSIRDSIVVAEPDAPIIDLDVSGYYPSLSIVNRVYPEHLGETWCNVAAEIKAERALHPKGSSPNKALKLAGNGSYGDTGSHFSPFFDMRYLLSITINGQLLLCMLAEWVMHIPGALLIQINTDGLTVKLPRDQLPRLKQITDWWQDFTKLDLEEVEYCRMFIRDVNNYIGEYTDGGLKRKGAYEHAPPQERNPLGWHQNLSAMVVPMAAEAHLVRGTPIRFFIETHPDIMDFMLRTKIKRSDQLVISDPTGEHGDYEDELQRITRYLVTKTGGCLAKISPPTEGYKIGQWKRANSLTDQFYNQVIDELRNYPDVFRTELDSTGLPWDARINTKNKSKYEERRTGIDVGWVVTTHNRIDGPIDRSTINYEYYIQETGKLVDQLKVVV